MKQRWSDELKKQKEAWQSIEKTKKDQWQAQKKKEITELTAKVPSHCIYFRANTIFQIRTLGFQPEYIAHCVHVLIPHSASNYWLSLCKF